MGGGDEHPPVRTLDELLAPHRVPGQPVAAARRAGARRCAQRHRARRGVPTRCTRCGRARGSRSTDSRSRAPSGAETSVDKILVATAEQQLFDAARELVPGVVELDDSPDGERWRSEYLYSRAATIYGGSAEIQRAQHRCPATARPRCRGVSGGRRAGAARQERAPRGRCRRPTPTTRSTRSAGPTCSRPNCVDAVSVVFGALGDLNVVVSSLDDVVLDALGATTPSGAAVALPAFGGWNPPGVVLRRHARRLDGLRVRVQCRGATPSPFPRVTATSCSWPFVPTEAIERTVIEGIAPEVGMSRLQAAVVQPVATETLASDAWDDALLAGRPRARHRARRHRARRCLVSPGSTCSTREQFGRPIAQFQAVRHRLAEVTVARPGGRAGRGRHRAGRARPDDGDARRSRSPGAAAGTAATPQPAGAGRHRVHRGAPAAPLREAHAAARRTARVVDPPAAGARRYVLATRQLPRLLDLVAVGDDAANTERGAAPPGGERPRPCRCSTSRTASFTFGDSAIPRRRLGPRALAGAGVTGGARLALMSANRPEFVFAVYGALQLGAVGR